MTTTDLTITAGQQEVVITRDFRAPRELVWNAHTDPSLIPEWWGPRRLVTTVEELDVRYGGAWRFVQRDAEGHEFAFRGVFHTVEPPVRYVATFEFEGAAGHVVLQEMVFDDLDGATRLTQRSVYLAVEDLQAMMQSGMESGVVESMERLDELFARS